MGALWQSEPRRTEAPEIPPAETPQPTSPRQRRLWWRLIILLLPVALIALGLAAYAAFRNIPIPHESYNALAELMIEAERQEHSDDHPIDGTPRMQGMVPNFHFRLHPTNMSHHQRIAVLRQCAVFLESITATTKNGRKRPSRRA